MVLPFSTIAGVTPAGSFACAAAGAATAKASVAARRPRRVSVFMNDSLGMVGATRGIALRHFTVAAPEHKTAGARLVPPSKSLFRRAGQVPDCAIRDDLSPFIDTTGVPKHPPGDTKIGRRTDLGANHVGRV